MSFVPDNVIQNLPSMDRSSADAQPFGVIKLSDDGVIQLYNKWESEMGGFEPSAVEGKNFFTKVAACTNNRLVFGRFKDGVSSGQMDAEFNYTFTYRMKPNPVLIRLYRDTAGNNWCFVSKK
ncbi:MAG: photoactive yellow protein [Myxococcota bacterium]